ncbi:hypothetical protein QN366_05070 [Pseudomonas sp. CCC3.2]|uniref:hypothetical protein n=1 Tax=unclassified Pseudomonas TaxID=196821 RepID=UPI002AB4ED4E|nr:MULTISPECIES: hypothetical protein [unclassified Pseudomonas]MDY7559914.1 hypothetical protein [Pseudomonas sp. AB6]MEA9994579.1 hypothetical protein [Pseudomonas sp. AA4]MEB0085724.1 hypothetical protein [Pseudomonas sp. RTI1]MEB0125951.1 hypothetical protein [Pseudomonas sp. CCC1.2]MEB0152755.1 hypothetical protein [Pseudomonas sp. CCC4.3]
MSETFKAGDLALIVDRKARDSNVGRVVRLIESLGCPDLYDWDGVTYRNFKGGQVWVIEADGQPLETRYAGYVDRGPICEWKLMPLRGDFAPEQQRAHELSA